MKNSLIISFSLLLLLGVAACEPNIIDTPEVQDPFSVSAEVETRTVTFEADNRWSIINNNDWFYVTPRAGLAGNAEVTVKFDENDTMKERKGSFYVIDGGRTLMYTFTQKSLDLIVLDNDEYYVPDEGAFTVVVRSNVDYTVSTDAEWITLPSETAFSGDGNEKEIEFTLGKNPSESQRMASLTFTTAQGKSFSAEIIQNGHLNIDWNKDFYKSILGYRFTGDWCGFCPYLEYDIKNFQKAYPDRLNVICFYDSQSSTILRYSYSSKYEVRFGVQGKPTWVLDERGQVYSVASPAFYKITEAVAEEDCKAFPAKSGIMATVARKNGKLSIHPVVYIKDKGEYHIHIALLESGIVVEQSDYTGIYTESQLKNFRHDNVVRKYATALLTGDGFSAESGSTNMFNYTCDIPSTVVNRNNLSVAIYITRPTGESPESVQGFTYFKDRTEFVDNSVIVPVGQSTIIKYEK